MGMEEAEQCEASVMLTICVRSPMCVLIKNSDMVFSSVNSQCELADRIDSTYDTTF